MTQRHIMRGNTPRPLPLDKSKHMADIKGIISNLHLRSHYFGILKLLRPIVFVMHPDALSMRHFNCFVVWRRQCLHEKLLVIFDFAIRSYSAEGYASLVLLARRPFKRGVETSIIDVVAPLAELSVKRRKGPGRFTTRVNRGSHFPSFFAGLRIP